MYLGPGFLYGVIKDFASWVAKLLKKTPPEEILKKRFEKKREFKKNHQLLVNSDIIIRDIKRMDSYPDIDDKRKGISPWFKLEYKGLYHKGVELFMRVESIKLDHENDKWNDCNYDDPDAVNALVVGRIPYEAIIEVDWEGDEYYPFPHFYCDFNTKDRMPYDEIIFVVPKKIGEKESFNEVGRYHEIMRVSRQTLRERITSKISQRSKLRG